MSTTQEAEVQRSFFMKTLKVVLNTTQLISPQLAGRLGYKTLGRPPKKEYTLEERSFLNTATASTLKVNNSTIQTYHWSGNREKILLAHGWDSHSGRWNDLALLLMKGGYEIFALDAPSHGASHGAAFTVLEYAAAIKKYAEICQPDFIIGHSAGGMAVVFELMNNISLSQDIKGLVLLGTPGQLNDFMEAFRQTLQLSVGVMESVDKVFMARSGYSIHHFDIREFAKSLDLPGLVIHDKYDDIAPFSGAESIHQNWRESTFFATENLGHSLQSDEVFEQVITFIQNITLPTPLVTQS